MALDDRLSAVRRRLADLEADLPQSAADSVVAVTLVSEFVLNALLKDGEHLLGRLADEDPLDRESLAARIDLGGRSLDDAMAELRRFRRLEMARLAWRDLAGWSSLEASLRDLSVLADCLIREAVDFAAALLAPRFGRPVDAEGCAAPLLVLAMGKLGGGELNFSSDVDLVLLYPDGAQFPNRDPIEVQSYYLRLVQLFIKLLDEVTEDGVVCRVDTRLRPFGASGPLAVSVPAFETYLVQHARDWERYAYVKARLVTGEEFSTQVFDEVLTPFVYRRYLDYGVFAALRQMKRSIRDEVGRREMRDNIKLGSGGIREVEFVAQVFQLIRGGSEPRLRARGLLDVLPLLVEFAGFSPSEVADLAAAYRYLRRVENRLQAMDDRQTHTLPKDEERRARLAYACGEPSSAALAAALAKHRRVVEREFSRVARDERAGADTEEQVDALLDSWESGTLAARLDATRLAHNEEAMRLLADLREGGLYRRMDEPSRKRLAAVITGLIPILEEHAAPDRILSRILPILQAICRRSAYLALLQENPQALRRLIDLVDAGPMLASQIAEHPLLLDELLDPRIFDAPLSRAELKRSLDHYIHGAKSQAVEDLIDAMRDFQRAAVFRIAIADRLGGLHIMKVSDRLTDTAELVLELALDIAWRELTAKHGRPMHGEGNARTAAGFAIVAYGKLGGLELGYGSDLDLVFLHDSAGSRQETSGPNVLDNQRFFVRLVQRLIHFLTVQTSAGRLYEIDTRLRPSGSKGLLVASLQSFQRYQRKEAWIWEHQALLRSRSVAGDRGLRKRYEIERREVLLNHVDRTRLRDEVRSMRGRMRKELSRSAPGLFDLKQDPGALADIEFLIDYWVLLNAQDFPELVAYPDNVRQLEALELTGLVTAPRCGLLKDGYLTFRGRMHELSLANEGRVVAGDEYRELRLAILAIWKEVFGAEADG